MSIMSERGKDNERQKLKIEECGGQGGKKVDLEKEGDEGGREEGRERGGILRTERKGDYEVLFGESNCKENGGISLPTKVERWSPSKSCRPEVIAL
jgi:hypothetical protein